MLQKNTEINIISVVFNALILSGLIWVELQNALLLREIKNKKYMLVIMIVGVESSSRNKF
jgi:hypothetical protein